MAGTHEQILPPRAVLVSAANANRYVREYRLDQEWWASCWSEESIANRPPVRVEFEHATFLGSLGEALSVCKGKSSWGAFLGVEPLREDDVLHPTRVVYVLKETNCMRMRWEFRDTMKHILGKHRRLVGDAVRQSKKRFVNNLTDSEERVLRKILDLTPSAFWQAARFGERYGPNGIQEFVRKLEERTKGAKGKRYTAKMIQGIRYRYQIPAPLKRAEEWTAQQIAKNFGVSKQVVYYWITHNVIQARRLNDGMPYWITLHPGDEAKLREWVRHSSRIRAVS